MTDGSRVAELLSERPDLEAPLEDILTVDERKDTWTFDDVPIDSGHFGELVSRGVVEKVDGQYQLDDPDTVRAALGEEPTGGAMDGTDEERGVSPSLSVSTPSVDVRAAGMLIGALASIVVIRSRVVGSVFRGEHVVLASNDPYYYRYWVEQLLSTGKSLAALGGPIKGEPLMIVTLTRIADLVGGVDTAGVVLALYPVVAAVLVGLLLYLFTMRLTADRRVALAAVVMLSITPGHALRTALGFADHHAFDYIWLMLTSLALLALVYGDRPSLRDRTTVLGVLGLGVGVGGQILAWDNGALLVVPVAAVVAGFVLLLVREGRSPSLAFMPIIAGLGLATSITLLGHVGFGWHSPMVAALPVVFLAGTIGVVVVGEIALRLGRPARELAVAEGIVAIIAVVGTFILVPDLWDRVRQGLGLIGRTDDIAEVAALFSGETMGFLLLFGFVLFVALPMLVLQSVRLYQGDKTWLVPVVYTWYFFVLSLFQVRFVGEVAAFMAIFAGLGFVWLAAKVDVTATPTPFDSKSRTSWVPDRPDSSTVFAVFALFLLVGGLGVIQSGVKIEQITVEDETYETAAWMATDAEKRELSEPAESYVFSEWGRNRLYNFFVNGDSRSYSYARQNYAQFLNETNPEKAASMLGDRVRYLVTSDSALIENSSLTMQARLHRHLGSHTSRLKGVGRFRALYVTESGDHKVFMPVTGARLTGRAVQNATIDVTTTVTIPGAEFTYLRRDETSRTGIYDLTVPYTGEYSVGNQTVVVDEEDVRQGQITGGFDGRGPHYWSFNEGVGDTAYDLDSGRHIDGVEGMWVDGANGSAIEFRADSKRLKALAHTQSLGRNKSLTISFLLKGNLSEANRTFPRVLRYSPETGGYGFWSRNNINDFGFRVDDKDGNNVRNFGIQTTSFESWTHIAVVLDRNQNEVRLYQNGSQVRSTDASGLGAIDGGGVLRLGPRSGNHSAIGIDELRIYNRALSSDELDRYSG